MNQEPSRRQEVSCPFKLLEKEKTDTNKIDNKSASDSNICNQTESGSVNEELKTEECEKELEFKKLQLEHIYSLMLLMKQQELNSMFTLKNGQRDLKFSVLGEDGQYKEEQLKSNFEDQLKLYGL
jgi:hypothetical protein